MPFLIPLAVAGVSAAVSLKKEADARNDKEKAEASIKDPMANQATMAAGNQYQNATGAAQGSLGQQQGLVGALQAQGGIQNQSDVYSQQQALAGQLGQMAQGAGPNPAAAQLAQATGQNNAAQTAMLAGQRGAGANAGLMARQIGQIGAQNQQQAVGQAATMRANQQLAAIGQLQNQQGMMGNLATTQVGQQTNAIGNLNQMNLAQQQQAANQQSMALNAAQGMNNNRLGQAGMANQAQMQQSAFNNQSMGGLAAGVGTAATALGTGGGGSSAPASGGMQTTDTTTLPASEGETPMMAAEGGEIPASPQHSSPMTPNLKENYSGPRSHIGMHLHKAKMAGGGKVANMKSGGGVPGKPKVPGARNSYANDTVDALLSPGEIVLPRSVTQSANPTDAAAKFVAAIKGRKGK